jgi:methionine synthase I (cobalamin-dependent)/5,10-methylenetetrahydrofolate reductase
VRIEDFQSRLSETILVADGAMGSMLYELVGVPRCLDELNATQPEVVFAIHQSYLGAGAQIIETNTFGANRQKLAAVGLGERVADLNHRGVKIAREARESARHEVLIAGSIGPLGIQRQVRLLPEEDVHDIFREQATALEERGVDLFVLETFSSVAELEAAIDAIRSFSRLPMIVEMTYSEECAALDGSRPTDMLRMVMGKEVQAAGANCTIGPQALLGVLREFSRDPSIALAVMPNAGFPKRIGDRVVYPRSSPEYFADFAREASMLGARIVGGCCGTTPEHVRAMTEAVKGLKPTRASADGDDGQKLIRVSVMEPAAKAAAARQPQSGVWKKIQARQFVVSVEIDPPKGVTIERIVEQVERLATTGHVDAIDINSGTLARVGMDAMVLAGALEARGIETIPHLTTRDANIIGLQAILLGAWTVGGVRNVLAITGDPPSLGEYPETSGVYEVDSIGLVKILARLNQGSDWAGKGLGGSTNFTIGVALNPVADDLDEEIRRFQAKVEAGAHFAMTQPLFDPAHWQAFLKRLGGNPPIPVLAGVWPLTSHKQAVRLNNEVPGILIPQETIRQMELAGAAARNVGFAAARRMLKWARTELAGAYLIPPFKRYEEVSELLD